MNGRDRKSPGSVIAVVQARMGSSRLPGKIMMEIAGTPMLKLILDRLKRAENLDQIILATSIESGDDPLEQLAVRESVECYRGSEADVLDRFYGAVRDKPASNSIVRVCGDNPLIDPVEVDRLVRFHFDGEYDYSFNHIPYNDNAYPDGVGAEILSRALLHTIWLKADQPHQREHCYDYIWDHWSEFRIGIPKAPYSIQRPDVRLDVDTWHDLESLRRLLCSLTYDQITALNTESVIQLYDWHGGGEDGTET